MIEEPTLFILGAGASKPYGFPTGRELRRIIIASFSSDFKSLLAADSSLRTFERDRHIEKANEFVDHFSRSPVYSIDQYLALNQMYQHYGKIAIAYYIRMSEIKSKFLEQAAPRYHDEDWYGLIFNRMIAGLKQPQDFEKFRENRVAFITFNYDRSLEYFLYTSFLNTFLQGRREFEDRLNEIIHFPIIHVYGQIGKWGKQAGEQWEEYLRYYRDDSITFKEIQGLAEGISIIGERSVEDAKAVIRGIVAQSRRIFFCGFGYAKENLDIFGFPITIEQKLILMLYGTAKGMTEKEIQETRDYLVKNISSLGGVDAKIEEQNTYDLLREFL